MKTRTMSYNEAALHIMLGRGDPKELAAALAHADGVRECPECGLRERHDHNNARLSERTYLCRECGTQFDEEV